MSRELHENSPRDTFHQLLGSLTNSGAPAPPTTSTHLPDPAKVHAPPTRPADANTPPALQRHRSRRAGAAAADKLPSSSTMGGRKARSVSRTLHLDADPRPDTATTATANRNAASPVGSRARISPGRASTDHSPLLVVNNVRAGHTPRHVSRTPRRSKSTAPKICLDDDDDDLPPADRRPAPPVPTRVTLLDPPAEHPSPSHTTLTHHGRPVASPINQQQQLPSASADQHNASGSDGNRRLPDIPDTPCSPDDNMSPSEQRQQMIKMLVHERLRTLRTRRLPPSDHIDAYLNLKSYMIGRDGHDIALHLAERNSEFLPLVLAALLALPLLDVAIKSARPLLTSRQAREAIRSLQSGFVQHVRNTCTQPAPAQERAVTVLGLLCVALGNALSRTGQLPFLNAITPVISCALFDSADHNVNRVALWAWLWMVQCFAVDFKKVAQSMSRREFLLAALVPNDNSASLPASEPVDIRRLRILSAVRLLGEIAPSTQASSALHEHHLVGVMNILKVLNTASEPDEACVDTLWALVDGLGPFSMAHATARPLNFTFHTETLREMVVAHAIPPWLETQPRAAVAILSHASQARATQLVISLATRLKSKFLQRRLVATLCRLVATHGFPPDLDGALRERAVHLIVLHLPRLAAVTSGHRSTALDGGLDTIMSPGSRRGRRRSSGSAPPPSSDDAEALVELDNGSVIGLLRQLSVTDLVMPLADDDLAMPRQTDKKAMPSTRCPSPPVAPATTVETLIVDTAAEPTLLGLLLSRLWTTPDFWAELQDAVAGATPEQLLGIHRGVPMVNNNVEASALELPVVMHTLVDLWARVSEAVDPLSVAIPLLQSCGAALDVQGNATPTACLAVWLLPCHALLHLAASRDVLLRPSPHGPDASAVVATLALPFRQAWLPQLDVLFSKCLAAQWRKLFLQAERLIDGDVTAFGLVAPIAEAVNVAVVRPEEALTRPALFEVATDAAALVPLSPCLDQIVQTASLLLANCETAQGMGQGRQRRSKGRGATAVASAAEEPETDARAGRLINPLAFPLKDKFVVFWRQMTTQIARFYAAATEPDLIRILKITQRFFEVTLLHAHTDIRVAAKECWMHVFVQLSPSHPALSEELRSVLLETARLDAAFNIPSPVPASSGPATAPTTALAKGTRFEAQQRNLALDLGVDDSQLTQQESQLDREAATFFASNTSWSTAHDTLAKTLGARRSGAVGLGKTNAKTLVAARSSVQKEPVISRKNGSLRSSAQPPTEKSRRVRSPEATDSRIGRTSSLATTAMATHEEAASAPGTMQSKPQQNKPPGIIRRELAPRRNGARSMRRVSFNLEQNTSHEVAPMGDASRSPRKRAGGERVKPARKRALLSPQDHRAVRRVSAYESPKLSPDASRVFNFNPKTLPVVSLGSARARRLLEASLASKDKPLVDAVDPTAEGSPRLRRSSSQTSLTHHLDVGPLASTENTAQGVAAALAAASDAETQIESEAEADADAGWRARES
ncbi:uncharacterized protein MONBRDRAFT_37699 [Monosiga brevicollis MX1]|uniref:Uncharacterized protein n=1 Tax=Monosiga brevicollis TaxID=81824 RepID=A9V3D0_MONBE|nr:uncharacterized protein MONBRDRAFT_37699 [Monosiga brevicollis MX1]EDQ88038.1 predicted protein [Monosiga brevicollis MX1]|eukprot:XP_001747114.1 hypothetical protein [Monosiga brevicollis MX1]